MMRRIHDHSCWWISQDNFFCRLAGPVGTTGIAIVPWVGYVKLLFYCATIAYHVELNAYADGRKAMTNVQEKWMNNDWPLPNTVGEPRSEIHHVPCLFLA